MASFTVHPRVYGELLRLAIAESSRPRFIPACTGNSAVGTTSRTAIGGSSPRVRGTPISRLVR